MSLRVLILNANRERAPHTLIPLGACWIASAARAAGHDVRLLDLTFVCFPEREAARAVQRHQPEVVGVSVRNIDNCDFAHPKFYLAHVKKIIRSCRQAGAGTIVLGGPAVTVAPEPLLRYLGGDFAIVGEGETSFPALLETLNNGSRAAVPGVATISGDEFSLSPSAPTREVSCLPDPAPEDWLELRRYLKYDSSMPVQTKRGCPFNCSYCLYPKIDGHGVRLRDPKVVASEVQRAERLGFRTAEFVDSVFNVPQEHAIACCAEIARIPHSITLQTLELNPAGCSAELIGAMNAARFSAAGCTAESGSEAMLESLGKGFGTEELGRAARELKKLDAIRLWMFMLGGPGETEATVAETSRFIEQSLTALDIVYVSCGVRILPGTRLHAAAIAEGIVSPYDDLLHPTFYFSPHLSAKRAMEMICGSSFPTANIVRLGDGNNRLIPHLQRVAHALRLSPPHWRWAPIWNTIRKPMLRGHYREKKC